mgnify:CR=1 FL=1
MGSGRWEVRLGACLVPVLDKVLPEDDYHRAAKRP